MFVQWLPVSDSCFHRAVSDGPMCGAGTVLRCDVTGKILMKCFLSGMPDLKLGLNDKIGLDKETQAREGPPRPSKRCPSCSPDHTHHSFCTVSKTCPSVLPCRRSCAQDLPYGTTFRAKSLDASGWGCAVGRR